MGGSGSGSGVISNYGGVASSPSSPPSNPPSGMTGPFGPPNFPLPPSTPSLASGPSAAVYQTGPISPVNMMPSGMMTPQLPQPQAQPRSNVLLIVITIGCFVIVALIIVMFGIRRGGGRDLLASNGTASAAPAVSTPAPPASTAESITIPTVTEVATKPPPPPSPAPVNRPTSRPQPAPQPRPAPAPQPAAEPAEPGFVTVNAYPWAKVTEGAKVICPATPCNKVQMSPGAHTLTFENGAEPSQKQTVTVQIKAGETTPKNIGFK
jgi:hypothetical protein